MARGRTAALLATGALGVHELRYLLAYGPHASEASAAQGHAYLALVGFAVAVAVAAAVARFARALQRALATGRAGEHLSRRFAALWARSALALCAAYTVQESLEGAFNAGHPTGVAGVVGDGGWTAFLVALAVAALIALLEAGTGAALRVAAHRGRSTRAARPCRRARQPALSVELAVVAPLARHLAGRAPPPAPSV